MKTLTKNLVLGLALGLSLMASQVVHSTEGFPISGSNNQVMEPILKGGGQSTARPYESSVVQRYVSPAAALGQFLGDGTVVEYTEAPPSENGLSATLFQTAIITCQGSSFPKNYASVESVTQCHLDLSKTKRVKLLDANAAVLDLQGLGAIQKELGFDFAFRSGNGLVWAIWAKQMESNNTYEKFFK